MVEGKSSQHSPALLWLLLGMALLLLGLTVSLTTPLGSVLTDPGMQRLSRTAVGRAWNIMRGELVDVGGRRLRMTCRGSGGPTVILEAGLGFYRETWNAVLPQVASTTKVCAYDRAGIGGSDRAGFVRNAREIASDLHHLLGAAHVPRPYVLVGHSFGGQVVRVFASEHPTEIAGIVLVDAVHEDQFQRLTAALPPEERDRLFVHDSGLNAEAVDIHTSSQQVRAARLPPVPIVVLSADPAAMLALEDADDPGWQAQAGALFELQADLSRISPHTTQRIVPGARHMIHVEFPDAVSEAIREMVREIRAR